jgi:post-segregation antitoxin (ccd killing protein)
VDDRWPAMKRKLTITVDGELLPRAKQYARSRGVSLSSLIEASLREMAVADTPSFASRWRGRFEAARRDGGRYEALARKCL